MRYGAISALREIAMISGLRRAPMNGTGTWKKPACRRYSAVLHPVFSPRRIERSGLAFRLQALSPL